MFSDKPTTPTRIEVLLELVNEMRHRKLDRDAIRKMLQPKGLPGLKEASEQANETLKAVRELGLVEEDKDGSYRPTWGGRRPIAAKHILLAALDDKVLSSTEIEPWFARFYSYAISKEDDLIGSGTDFGNKWATGFNRDLYGGQPPSNPFNPTKYSKLRNWLRYAGLGWHDSQDNFVPNPYERIRRQLNDIFEKRRKLTSDEFMSKLATHCPELDDGAIFRDANKGYNLNRTCTRAVATALRDLHDDRLIRLDCPRDSRGWSLSRAGVVRNPNEGLYADEFDFIEVMAPA